MVTQDMQDKVPVALIEQLVEDIQRAVGVRVSFTASTGEKLAMTEYKTELCRMSQQDPEMLPRCDRFGCRIREIAWDREDVVFCRCWRGLMSACKSVRANGQVVGCLLLSGYASEEWHMEEVGAIDLDPAYEVADDQLSLVPQLHPERVRDVINVVSIAANYLSEAYQRQEAQRLQAEAEFRALQSQISPHFLFNTLNAISQMALLEGAERTPDAICSLAELLRSSMRQTSGLIPLEEELEFVHEYIRLKQMTGLCPIAYEEEVEPEALLVPVPVLSIQPLVENAIYHGLEPGRRGGTVSLTAGVCGAYLMVAVTDDGAGFDIAVTAQSTAKLEVSGIGFNNVIRRLQLFYAKKFNYEVVSAPGEGTTVTLFVPI